MSKHMSDEYWRDLILAARTSGLTDAMWCEKHGVVKSSFYNHIRKLRNKGYEIPEATGVTCAPVKQEVVPITLVEEEPLPATPSYETNPNPALCLYLNGTKIEISNHADATLIRSTLLVVNSLC